LRRVELTPEIIGGLIRHKVDLTMDALTKAWEQRPEGDQEAEDQLLDILARTQKLQREVKKTFSEEKMKQLSKALKRAHGRASSPKKTKTSSLTKRKRPTAKKRQPKKTPSGPRVKRGSRK
jgi:CHAD domain-containing protein